MEEKECYDEPLDKQVRALGLTSLLHGQRREWTVRTLHPEHVRAFRLLFEVFEVLKFFIGELRVEYR